MYYPQFVLKIPDLSTLMKQNNSKLGECEKLLMQGLSMSIMETLVKKIVLKETKIGELTGR